MKLIKLTNANSEIQMQISNSQMEISNITNNYNAALGSMVSTLNSDKEKINTYIQ